ncbi:MAG: hypothetical protein KGQ42_04255, partial [Alphaproteobacteria bacterium]|nr:hypothetical protein [Alphaproteobacteria bacterium]
MKYRIFMLATAMCGLAGATSAQAAHKRHVLHPRHARPAAAVSQDAELKAEIESLKSEVGDLKARLDSQSAQQASVSEQAQAANSQAQTTASQLAAVQQTVAADNVQIADARKSVEKVRQATDHAVKITPGGFLEAAGIYRQHFMGEDIPTAFQNIPFPNAHSGYIDETRLTARQSRFSILFEGMATKTTKLSMYGEFDFLGAAQTANSNESNSYQPRIRNLYGTVDWTKGSTNIHLLGGQNWSLVTLNSK